MEPLYLVLAGGAVSLISSVTVTWLQGRAARRGETRQAIRDCIRQLTSIFISEREKALAPAPAAAPPGASGLAEAEMLCTMIADRRTRERVRDVIRLLRASGMPELQELSGVRAPRARRALCTHALDVLGAHYRGERIPAPTETVKKLMEVEDEALQAVYSDALHDRDADEAEEPAEPETTAARRPRAASAPADAATETATAEKGGAEKSAAKPASGGTGRGGRSAR
ncbi:hypothetical protein [Allonocardiopsis opalescens]|nr:hypothetical protein [Allonocardiopsis opalescens]